MKTEWEEWPKWHDEGEFSTPRFRFTCSITDFTGKTSAHKVYLLKYRGFIDIYRDLILNDSMHSILELGFFQGGMPLFLADMVNPDKIVAVDWNPPSDELTALIARSGLSSTIELIGGVDQADTARIRSILDEQFKSKPLDLIIDDCSHYYNQTKACFEALFGYLRPGGKYIIEDWGWTHWPGAPWQTGESQFCGTTSMTNLIFELVMAHASDSTTIASVNIVSPACVIVTRGASLLHTTPVNLHEMTLLADDRKAELIVAKSETFPSLLRKWWKAKS